MVLSIFTPELLLNTLFGGGVVFVLAGSFIKIGSFITKLDNLDKRYKELSTDIHTLRGEMNNLGNRLDNRIDRLESKIDQILTNTTPLGVHA